MTPPSSSVRLAQVVVDFPVFNASSLSLKNRVLHTVTGGKISRDSQGVVQIRSLNGVSLAIGRGERGGLVGHNGAGKTTLLRVIAGIYHPTGGVAEIRGTCTSLIDIHLGIDPEATGRENIVLRGTIMGLSRWRIEGLMDEVIEFSGLGEFIDMPFRTYSSGMQMRLAFAVSTAVRPQILIMDEWLSTGDAAFSDRARQRMQEVVRSTDILVLASHSREVLLQNCQRLIWLEHGEVVMDGPCAEVEAAYFGDTGQAQTGTRA